MAFNLSNPVGTGTDQELLEFTRAAIAEVLLHGHTRWFNGKQVVKSDLPQLRDFQRELEARIAAVSGSGASSNIARRGRVV